MRFREALQLGGKYQDSELKDVCVSISTILVDYKMAFIEAETQDYLICRVTRPDFTEGLVIINKDHVVSIAVVYQNDVVITTEKDYDPSYV